jgi:hypothetical protein
MDHRAQRFTIPLRTAAGLVLASLLFGLLGCGQNAGPRRYEVSGKVSYRGQPIRVGYINFDPDSSAGNSGPGSMTKIIDGSYRTQPGKGAVGGPHRVWIVGFDGAPADGLGDGNPLFKEVLYTVDLPRKPVVQDFDVSDEQRRN